MDMTKYAPVLLWMGLALVYLLMAVLFFASVWLSARINKFTTQTIRRALWVGIPQGLIMAVVITSAQLSKTFKPLPAIFMAAVLAVLAGLVLIWRVYRTKGKQTLKVWIAATLLQVLLALPLSAGALLAVLFGLAAALPPVY